MEEKQSQAHQMSVDAGNLKKVPDVRGRPQRHVIAKTIAGGMTGLIVFFPLLALQTDWEDVIAAAAIGAVAGLVDRSPRTVWLCALACASGWLVGSAVFGIWIEMGAGAWILAGAFLGAASGFLGGSAWRAGLGFLLGLVAGLVAEVSRYLTLLAEPLRTWDMHFILLVMAGLLLNLVAAGVGPSTRLVDHD